MAERKISYIKRSFKLILSKVRNPHERAVEKKQLENVVGTLSGLGQNLKDAGELFELARTGKRTALLGICAAGGLGAAAVLERVET